MASAKASKESKKATKAAESEGGGYLVPAVIIVAVIAIALVLGYLASSTILGGGGGGQQSLQGFENSFYAAQRVGIYVTYLNGSSFAYADGCASNLIESITASRSHHRNMTTIDLMIIANSTSCLAPNGPLGSANGTKVIPISSCLAISHSEPSIFINYSDTNSTAVRSGNLYTSGDALFLSECGISSELG